MLSYLCHFIICIKMSAQYFFIDIFLHLHINHIKAREMDREKIRAAAFFSTKIRLKDDMYLVIVKS